MKRRDYERPTMQVVEIQQRGLLMVSGDVTMTVTYDEEDI